MGRRIWESGEEVGLRSSIQARRSLGCAVFQQRGAWWALGLLSVAVLGSGERQVVGSRLEEGSGEEPRWPSACVPTCACSGERFVLTVSWLLDGAAGQICRDKSKPDQERS